MKTFKKILSVLILILSVSILFGCENFVTTKKTTTKPTKTESTTITTKKEEEKLFRDNYTPSLFTYVSLTKEEITDGLILYTHEIVKSNGDITVIKELEVDLSLVNIVAGTKNNMSYDFNYSKTTPHNAGVAYTEATNKKVYATLNADFFGSYLVNAFVKDGFIVKDSHNDNGNYDYKNTSSDVPASAPMLFGVKGDTAQVAPIINYTGTITDANVKKNLIQAKLSYEVKAGIKTFATSDTFKITSEPVQVTSGDMYAILDLQNGVDNVAVIDLYLANQTKTLNELSGSQVYLYCSKTNTQGIEFMGRLGTKVSLSVKSPDGLWDGYTTILGCRQALVINNEIASTVKLENTNGAQSGDIPRSAVGVNKYGKVCIYAVESMYYGKKNSAKDTHGCNLPLLAEFMYYNNIVNGANFDGGGSTQLIVKLNGTDTVIVRSSDTGSTQLDNTRQVMNAIMVVEK